ALPTHSRPREVSGEAWMNPKETGGFAAAASPGHMPAEWDRAADIVVVGAGATGLPAAIVAREAGCSVILVEAEQDIGGHAIISGGQIPPRAGPAPPIWASIAPPPAGDNMGREGPTVRPAPPRPRT